MTSGVTHCFSTENRSKPTSVRICTPCRVKIQRDKMNVEIHLQYENDQIN